ncbi:TatD family hydrolase [Bombilactobacillus folatiphilus]|uniref:TatD family hydrolase n=1 Tax=Bombilactobacillus folatiphilus TaxID=2923362 RepID=A0ABY4P995_9LACO|nr:TatD family hydrolase [Bombilactobacillus folatiphilus]UQS82303.1 TatD family hydrolase [Bombilactobacillus folatiphilus]
MQIFDTHTHLNDDPLWDQTPQYLQQAQQLGVIQMAIVGSNAKFNQRALQLARHYEPLFAVLGWHPEDSAHYDKQEQERLITQLQDPKAVAIGEIGLDYHWSQNPEPKIQQAVLIQQLELAQQFHLPVNIHTREAMADTYAILKDHLPDKGVIMHSFNGSEAWLAKFLELGCYISYSGVVSFKNAPEVRQAAIKTPLNRLLVETDAPYLTPEPHRGELNQPAFSRFVLEAIANCRDESLEHLAQVTYQNAHEVYGLNEKN